MESIQKAFNQESILLDLDAQTIPEIFRQTISHLVDEGFLSASTQPAVEAALLDRESQVPTALGHAVAVPNAYLEQVTEPIVVFVRLARPVNLGAPDGISTRFLFFMIGPEGARANHLDTLANIARIMSDDEFRYDAGRARSGKELVAALNRFVARRSAEPRVVPSAAPEGLANPGYLFGGLRLDIARRLPRYVSDIRDGLHSKCIAATFFLFFACLAPAVTFGGIMAVETAEEIGAVEMIVATALCGIVYSLFSGQPLIILGGTGPMLVFTAILYRMCQQAGVPFLPVYGWVGLWSALILLILAAANASCLMRYFTRFTDETFAALISIIFIYEAIRALFHIFQDLDVKRHHDTALLSLLLALGTFYIAMNLSQFRRSSYLLPWMREFLSDFGPTIALVAMTLISIWLHEVFLDVLPAPEEFGTTSGRPWTVDLFAAPTWIRFAAAGPAMLATVLVFLDQNITARLVNSRDHRLQKGPAYHLDLAVVGGLIGICSLFGLPWLVAATVRSINHVHSLATFDEVVLPGGECRERVIHVRENRISSFFIHVLIGFSLLLLPWLKTIPLAVLYGLFLYMGVVSMTGNQFFERLSLWLKDPALYPTTHYVRNVRPSIIHLYTLVQLLCLCILWLVKTSAAGILFPLFVALLVPVRFAAGYFFTPWQLAALDAEEEPEH